MMEGDKRKYFTKKNFQDYIKCSSEIDKNPFLHFFSLPQKLYLFIRSQPCAGIIDSCNISSCIF